MLKEQRDLIFERLGYAPTPEQAMVHDSLARIRLVAGGERGGKSKLASMDLMGRYLEGKLYWLVGAEFEATKAEYDYICQALAELGINYEATKHVNPGEIRTEGGIIIMTKSAKDPRKIMMQAPDGIVACEAAQMDFETFLRLRGRIAEKRGWLLLEGTFESSLGWYPELYTRWSVPNEEGAASFSLPTWSNTKIYPGGRTDPEIKALEAACSEDWFYERYGGVPRPPKGRVFTEFHTNIHTGMGDQFDFDPSNECFLWIDPGYAHSYAVIVAQKKGDIIYIVDEVYERGLVTSDIITVCKQKPWWNRVVGGAIDIAGTQHQAMAAPTEIWLQEGGIPLRYQKIRLPDGIERLKASLKVNPLTGHPGILINSRCKGLISELGGCPNPITNQTAVYKWRTDKEGNVVGDIPEPKNDDAIKAVIYGLVDLLGYTEYQQGTKINFF